jgi:hypothetical protein
MTGSNRTAPALAEVPAGRLVICHRCRGLKGSVPGRADGARQLCECTPVEVRRAQPRWDGDFNTYAELCCCCGLVLLRSGSRWSAWFCEPCKKSVVALNQSAGRCLVPIGRHSLMNGVAARPSQLASDTGVRTFADQLSAFFDTFDSLEAWARTIVESNLIALGLDADRDVRLGDYLDAIERSSLSRSAAFEALASRTAGRAT